MIKSNNIIMCKVCGAEVFIPALSNIIYIQCPNCETMLRIYE